MSRENKKVLIITPYFYPEGGGQENYAYQISKHNPDFDWQVACLSRQEDKVEILSGIKVHRFKASLIISNTPIKFFFLFKLLKLIRQEKFDLIQAHTPVPFAVDCAALASRLTGVPLVVTYHSDNLLKRKFFIDLIIRIYLLIERFTLKQAQKIITVSPHINRDSQSQTIFPGVDLDSYHFQQYQLGNNLLFISPLASAYSGKGLDILLASLKIVKEKNIDFKLNIAGSKGDAYEKYLKLTKKYSLSDRVNFLGHLNQSQMITQYQKNQVVIVPSRANTEGTPTVILEAQAIGRPVIASNTSGIPYIVKDNISGLLFEPGNKEQLAEAIIKLLKNQDLAAKIGKEGRANALNYSWPKISQDYAKVYQEIIN